MSTEATIGAYDAKTRFSQLLERVEAGESIVITRHGTPVAKIVPIKQGSTEETRREAIQAMRKLASRLHLGDLRVRDLRAEGRR